jgi:hypothetical protein
VSEQFIKRLAPPGAGQDNSSDDSQGDNLQDNGPQEVNLEELAQLIFRKLHDELQLENERFGRLL